MNHKETDSSLIRFARCKKLRSEEMLFFSISLFSIFLVHRVGDIHSNLFKRVIIEPSTTVVAKSYLWVYNADLKKGSELSRGTVKREIDHREEGKRSVWVAGAFCVCNMFQ